MRICERSRWAPLTLVLLILAGVLLGSIFPQEKFSHWPGSVEKIVPAQAGKEGSPAQNGETYVHFLDVGHGQAVLLQSSGKNYLFDGGDIGAVDRLIELLRQYGVERIDALFLTRTESEAIGAVHAVLSEIGVERIYDGNLLSDRQIYRLLLRQAENLAIAYYPLEAGDELRLAPDMSAYVLAPLSLFEGEGGSTGEKSLTVAVEVGQVRFLMSGSLLHREESSLVRLYGHAEGRLSLLRADVLHVPRHGARDAAMEGLLQSVRPKVAIVHAGPYNERGLPDLQLLERLERYDISVYRTDRMGNISVWTDGRSWGVRAEFGGDDAAGSIDE